MIVPLDAATLARPVRLGDPHRAPRVEPVTASQAAPELALRYSNGLDTVEISRAAFDAFIAFADYTAARGFSPDGLPVRLPAVRAAAGTRLGA